MRYTGDNNNKKLKHQLSKVWFISHNVVGPNWQMQWIGVKLLALHGSCVCYSYFVWFIWCSTTEACVYAFRTHSRRTRDQRSHLHSLCLHSVKDLIRIHVLYVCVVLVISDSFSNDISSIHKWIKCACVFLFSSSSFSTSSRFVRLVVSLVHVHIIALCVTTLFSFSITRVCASNRNRTI